MNKLFTTAVAAFTLGFGLVGCNVLNPEESTTPEITITAIGAINAGTFKNVTGQIKAGEAITSIGYSVTNSAGAVVASIEAVGPTSSLEKTLKWETTNAIKITVPANASAGDYNLKITATAGATVDASFPFTVTGGSTEDTLKTQQVTVGNQLAASGSALDVDEMVVYTSAQCGVVATQVKVDAWFGITTSGPKMMAPSVAAGFAPDGWTSKNATQFLPVTASFETTKTQTAIDALWNATGATYSVPISAGDVFVIKTSTGNRLLKIDAASTAENGVATVTGRIK